MGEPEPVGTSSLKIVWSLGDHAQLFHPSPVREGTTGGSAVRAQQAGLAASGLKCAKRWNENWNTITSKFKCWGWYVCFRPSNVNTQILI
jgi:hypothetical protein